jgi:hypothetical protein
MMLSLSVFEFIMMDEESLFSIEQVFRSPFPFLSKSMHFVDHPFPAVFFGFTQKQFKWPTREVTVRRIPRRDREGKITILVGRQMSGW